MNSVGVKSQLRTYCCVLAYSNIYKCFVFVLHSTHFLENMLFIFGDILPLLLNVVADIRDFWDFSAQA